MMALTWALVIAVVSCFKKSENFLDRCGFGTKKNLISLVIVTKKKFNRHCRNLILVERFLHHVSFSLLIRLLVDYIFVFERNVEGSWMALLMRSRRIRQLCLIFERNKAIKERRHFTFLDVRSYHVLSVHCF